ncbi:hypothetical protein [Burkholderia cepacia]|uniref:hypothetical protein n=1 Tax=Burkholderia cepacia TaxID=292 RepID=UPI002FDF897A
MNLGSFKVLLELCGYPQSGPGNGGAGSRGVSVVAQSAVAQTVTGTTNQTVLASVTIPAGSVSPNGVVRITPLFTFTNNANVKNLSITFGGATVLNTNQTNAAALQSLHLVRNRGVLNSQVMMSAGSAGIGPSTGLAAASAVDTSQAVALVFSGTLANASDSITLEGYTVEVLNP